jgi:hypothetical protein
MYGNRWDVEELKGQYKFRLWLELLFWGTHAIFGRIESFSMFVIDHCCSSMKYFCLFIEIRLKVHHYSEMVIVFGNGHETERWNTRNCGCAIPSSAERSTHLRRHRNGWLHGDRLVDIEMVMNRLEIHWMKKLRIRSSGELLWRWQQISMASEKQYQALYRCFA